MGKLPAPSECQFPSRPAVSLADPSPMPAVIQPTPRLALRFPSRSQRFHSEPGGTVGYVVAKRAERPGDARGTLLRRALGYYKKVGLVKAIRLASVALWGFPGTQRGYSEPRTRRSQSRGGNQPLFDSIRGPGNRRSGLEPPIWRARAQIAPMPNFANS